MGNVSGNVDAFERNGGATSNFPLKRWKCCRFMVGVVWWWDAFKARLGLRTKEFKDDVLGEGGEVGGFGDLKMSKKKLKMKNVVKLDC